MFIIIIYLLLLFFVNYIEFYLNSPNFKTKVNIILIIYLRFNQLFNKKIWILKDT